MRLARERLFEGMLCDRRDRPQSDYIKIQWVSGLQYRCLRYFYMPLFFPYEGEKPQEINQSGVDRRAIAEEYVCCQYCGADPSGCGFALTGGHGDS